MDNTQESKIEKSNYILEHSFLEVGMFGDDIAGMMKDLVKAQLEIPTIEKDGAVKGKNGSVQYKYGNLDTVLGVIKPILAKNNLVLTQNTYADGINVGVQSLLIHSSGSQYRTSPLIWNYYKTLQFNDNQIQNIGAILTYLKKSQLFGLLGIEFEDDKTSEKNFSGQNKGGYQQQSKQQYNNQQPKQQPQQQPKSNEPPFVAPIRAMLAKLKWSEKDLATKTGINKQLVNYTEKEASDLYIKLESMIKDAANNKGTANA